MDEPTPQWKMGSQPRLRRFTILSLLLFGAMVVTLLVYRRLDTCESVVFKNSLCDLYRRNIITGPLCPQLCDTESLHIVSCQSSMLGSRRVYYTDKLTLKLGNQDGLYRPEAYAVETRFSMPTVGTRMAQFRALLIDYVLKQLGVGDRAQIYRRIVAMADVNSDGKLSLAEAKTLWALLQTNEFFLLLVLHDSPHVPKLSGFCGDVYAHATVPHSSLYSPDQGLAAWFTPWPHWTQRAKIAVGLLEFALEIYQHSTDGTFYACFMHGNNVGYSDKYDIQILDLSFVLSNASLYSAVRERHCEEDKDCTVTPQCVTVCHAQHCTPTVTRPSVTVVCGMLHNYIMPGLPGRIRDETKRLLDRCMSLDSRNRNNQLEHSLVVNDLKTLLWKQISD